jgi:hypothetical protein
MAGMAARQIWLRAGGAFLINCFALFVLGVLSFLGIPVGRNSSFLPLLVLACSFSGYWLLRSHFRTFIAVQIATFACLPFMMLLSAEWILENSTL